MRVRPHAWRPPTVLGRLEEHETLLDGAKVVGAGGLGRLEENGSAATAAAVMDDRTEVQLGRRNDIDGGDSESRAAKADDIGTSLQALLVGLRQWVYHFRM